jgi:hypothetical protein
MNTEQALERLEGALAELDAAAHRPTFSWLSPDLASELERRVIDAARAYVTRVRRIRNAPSPLGFMVEPLWRESDDLEVLRLGQRFIELEWDIERVTQQELFLVKRLYEDEWLRLYEELCARVAD